MKTIDKFVLLFSFLLVLSCSRIDENSKLNKSIENDGLYRIHGYVENRDGEEVILSDSTGSIIGKTIVENNEFSLTGNPIIDIAFLHFDNEVKEPMFLDTLNYEVRSWDNNYERFLINSSHPKNITYNRYRRNLENINNQIYGLLVSLEMKNTKNRNDVLLLIKGLEIKRKDLIKKFIAKNNKRFIGLFELKRQIPFLGQNYAATLFKMFDAIYQRNALGVEITKDLNIEEKVVPVSPKEPIDSSKEITTEDKVPIEPKKPERFPAPKFSGLSPEGYLIDLQEIIQKNEVIMLDFWGSWCQPCRMQNPFWIRLYNKYKDKGFEIVSIAEETVESRINLETAIETDNMTWKHIADENYEIAELYRAFSLPHAVLIDKEGNIIYNKASARDVQEFLSEYFD